VSEDAIAYSEEVAATVRQTVPNMLQEPWAYHRQHFTNSPDSILLVFEALTKRLPGGIWEELQAALQQWSHAMRAQYDAVEAITQGYHRGVGVMTQTDREIGGKRNDCGCC
jgi:hypothetical protein